MNGAREYATMFSSGQYGRLYLISGEHARGKTFHIWVSPSTDKHLGEPWSDPLAVEVYGITGGNPGWSETYGWLYYGRWTQDFADLVKARQAEIAGDVARREQEKADAESADRQRKEELLAMY